MQLDKVRAVAVGAAKPPPDGVDGGRRGAEEPVAEVDLVDQIGDGESVSAAFARGSPPVNS